MKEKQIEIIILTSDEPWCEIWHTQLHYAYQLSKRVQVIFLGPPDAWNFMNFFRFQFKQKIINSNLVVITYINFLPASLGKLALWVNDNINSRLLNRRVLQQLPNQRGIIWHFDRQRSLNIFKGNSNFRHIYHVIDPVTGNKLDVPLSLLADVVIVTSPKFIDHYRSLNSKVIQIGQGVDLKFYREAPPAENHSVHVSENSIMLLGTITDQVHFDLLIRIAHRFPNRLVIIGPDRIIEDKAKSLFGKLLEVPGVTWLGPMEPALFRYHLLVCKVGIIAYNEPATSKNNLRSPLKAISYLACNKPIISNIDCEIPVLVDKAIYIAVDDNDFIEMIEKVDSGYISYFKTDVDEYLQLVSYDTILEKIFNELHEPLPGIK